VPILGAFFRTSRTERDQKELLMIVSPHLVRPIASGADLPALPGAEGEHFSPSAWDLVWGRIVPREDDSGFAP
jgi:pilus assembly protein CpaC